MRETADRLLDPDAASDVLPPNAAELDTLTVALRGHLESILPVVELATGPRPNSMQSYCALACVGEARGKLAATPGPGLESRVAHARRLARSLKALCDHYERLGGRR